MLRSIVTRLRFAAPGREDGGFLRGHLAAGAAGLALAAAAVAAGGWPEWPEAIALGWLAAPLGFAAWARFDPAGDGPRIASILSLAGLVAYVAALTGGPDSPFVYAFAVAPLEAILSGRRHLIALALFAGLTGLALLAAAASALVLPPPRLEAEVLDLLRALAPAAIVLYAGAIAFAAASQAKDAARDAADGAWRYRILADNAADMISRHLADGRIVFVSPACLALLGYRNDELMGRTLDAFLDAEGAAAAQRAFAEASYRGRPARAELKMRRKDGGHVWVEMRCRPAADGASPRDIVAVTRDVSDRKAQETAVLAARDEAEGASRAKTRFLANMSHELRTPLNAIIGFSDMMRQETFGSHGHPKYAEYSRLIHDSGQHLLALIGDILDMAKIEAGRLELARETLALPGYFEAARAAMQVTAEKAGVRVAIDGADAVPPVFADRRAVKQILLNLLSNALKFTPKGGSVTLGARVEAGQVALFVRDTGVGIPKDALARIGQPFEQVEGELTRAKPGTGLGLAIVKSLAALHGGAMRIESKVGEGTAVTVLLPAAYVPPVEAAPEPETEEEAAADNVVYPRRFRAQA